MNESSEKRRKRKLSFSFRSNFISNSGVTRVWDFYFPLFFWNQRYYIIAGNMNLWGALQPVTKKKEGKRENGRGKNNT